jgi:uncharacterized protein YbaR (Trm112 family)/ketosteroid isomerase-like protein
MLICLSCNIEYEEDKKFCSYCGGPLVAKEDPTAGHKNVEKKVEEELGQKLVCPNCKIVYQFGSSCIQCGSALETMVPAKEKEAPETDLKKPEDERERLQTQEPEGQPVKEPRQNLICPTCKITYEHGNYCIKCGLILVPQISTQTEEEPKIPRGPEVEEKATPLQTFQEQMDETSRKRLICPHCKIIYERGSSCVRCGTALVTQISSQEEKKPGLPEVAEVKKEDLQVAPTPEEEIKEEHPQTQTPEEEPTEKKGEGFEKRLSLPRKRKRDYRRLFRDVGSITIMVVAGGYFLWAIYSHLITSPPEPKTASSKEVTSQILPGSSTSTTPALPVVETKENSSPSNAALSDNVAAETMEIGKIKDLLEKIRQANLRKDIDLFLSCYASDFKDREGKKKATLAHWKNFDYIDLSYDLKNPSISANTAKARVEWLIKISPYTGGQPRESKTILDVILRKEGGEWKIEEVKSTG